MLKNVKYKYLVHRADLAIKGYGKDLADLFLNIATGMYEAVIGKRKESIKARISNAKNFRVEGETPEDLLVGFLNELIYIIETKRKILQNIKIRKIKKGEWEFSGIPSPLSQEKIEIKAATYHNLKIKRLSNQYQAQVVFDI